MRPLASLVMLAALLVAVAVGAAPAGSATGSKCKRLRGKDLAPARYVKLVARPNADDGSDLVGCTLPRGRVYEIASSADQFTTMYAYRVRQVAGRIVLVDSSYSSQYASTSSTRVWDLRSGRGYPIAYSCFEIGGSDCAGGSNTAPAAFVTRGGRAVAAIASAGGEGIVVAGFGRRGSRADFDSGPAAQLPPASLALTGNVASWTSLGQPRSADLRFRTRG